MIGCFAANNDDIFANDDEQEMVMAPGRRRRPPVQIPLQLAKWPLQLNSLRRSLIPFLSSLISVALILQFSIHNFSSPDGMGDTTPAFDDYDFPSLIKMRSTAQGSFSRLFNALSSVKDSSTSRQIAASVSDLEGKYATLDGLTEALFNASDDNSDDHKAVTDKAEQALQGCYLKLHQARGFIDAAAKKEDVPVAQPVIHNQPVAGDSTSVIQTLAESVIAASTVPPPKYREFSGDSREYCSFISYIETHVEKALKDKRKCLDYVANSCVGEAKRVVEPYQQQSDSDTAYKNAKAALKENFGRDHVVIKAHLADCTDGPVIKARDVVALKSLAISLRSAEVTITRFQRNDILLSEEKLVKINSRLPFDVRNEWLKKLENLATANITPSITHMREVIERYVRMRDNDFFSTDSASKPGASSTASNSATRKDGGKQIFSMTASGAASGAAGSATAQSSNNSNSKRCFKCNEGHYLNECPQYRQMSIKQRYQFVTEQRLCRNCLHKGHLNTKCPRKGLCKQCSGKHSDTLHDPSFTPRDSTAAPLTASTDGVASSASTDQGTSTTFLTQHSEGSDTLPIELYESECVNALNNPPSNSGLSCIEVVVEGKDCYVKCKAMVDRKSTATLATERLMSRLNLDTVPYQTTFKVATGCYDVKGYKLDETRVFSIDMENEVTIRNVLSVPDIPLSHQSFFTQSDIDAFSHLDGIELPTLAPSDEIDLLIGSNCPKAFHVYEQRHNDENSIHACRLTLGWDLVGPKGMGDIQTDVDCHAVCAHEECIFITSNGRAEYFEPSKQFVHSSKASHNVEDSIPSYEDLLAIVNDLQTCNKDFDDFSLFDEKLCPSKEDRIAEKLVHDSIVHKDDHYTVGIPWKCDPQLLPNTYELVLKRMNSLKKRFLKDPILHKEYTENMEKFIANSYIEEDPGVADSDLNHFLCHHPAFHPLTKALRVVFDCNITLNDFIFPGPNNITDYSTCLMRFRRFPIAVSADIRKMYLSIGCKIRDRGALKLLWWPNGDLSQPLKVYRGACHLYGVESSGYIANRIRELTANFTDDPLAKQVIRDDNYVDNLLTSFVDLDTSKRVIPEVISSYGKGGYHLGKFISNAPECLENISSDNKISEIDLSLSDENDYSTMGFKWNLNADTLSFPCRFSEDEGGSTRRFLLSLIARSQGNDPLGICSPCILPLRIMHQNKLHLDWDEHDDELASRCTDFIEILKLIASFSVPRCYVSSTFQFPAKVRQLHGFGDASMSGYSSGIYLRQVSATNTVELNLVNGKSRIAPKFKGKIPQATLPKLEMQSAAQAAKLMKKVRDALDLDVPDDQIFLWTDNFAILNCIRNSDKRFSVFWANRLAVIHGNSLESQWHWCPTKSNPADVGSRGIDSKNFDQLSVWTGKIDFLKTEPIQWPAEPSPSVEDEAIFMIAHVTPRQDFKKGFVTSPLLRRMIDYFSNYNKLLRITAILRRRLEAMAPLVSPIPRPDAREIELAKSLLIKFEQRDYLNLTSLRKLKPFIADDGFVRAEGRLALCSMLPKETRMPIILSKNSHLTHLIIQEEDKTNGHPGDSHVLSNLRKIYWITGGRSTVQRALRHCRKCIEEKARPLVQVMAPLPDDRLVPGYPFRCVGIDYFGPFNCKVGRRYFKRYGCIFVCTVTRAIHIEIANSLESEAFLCCFSRFIARRGSIMVAYSDNGTNLTAAEDEIKAFLQELDEAARVFCAVRSIEWNFHPPLASHHGGHYERLIRSVRKILRGITSEQVMTEDNLVTSMCEVERILNDRPLMPVSADCHDMPPLTPSNILLGRPHGSSNNSYSLYGKEFSEREVGPRQYHKQVEYFADVFWARLMKEYIPLLQTRQKWLQPCRNLSENDLILMTGEGSKRGCWPLARVVEAHPDPDGFVRSVTVQDKNSLKRRPVSKLALLEAAE